MHHTPFPLLPFGESWLLGLVGFREVAVRLEALLRCKKPVDGRLRKAGAGRGGQFAELKPDPRGLTRQTRGLRRSRRRLGAPVVAVTHPRRAGGAARAAWPGTAAPPRPSSGVNLRPAPAEHSPAVAQPASDGSTCALPGAPELLCSVGLMDGSAHGRFLSALCAPPLQLCPRWATT